MTIIKERLRKLKSMHLLFGKHDDDRYGKEMCAMEAVAWIAGEPHTDSPVCASPVISTFMRTWNDGLQTDTDRDRLLKPLIPLMVDSKGTSEQEYQRSLLALEWHNSVLLPAFLDLVPSLADCAAAVRADPLNEDVLRAAHKEAAAVAWDVDAQYDALEAGEAAAWVAAGDAAGHSDALAWDAAEAAVRAAAGAPAGAAAAVEAAGGTALRAAALKAAAGAASRDVVGSDSHDPLSDTVAELQVSAVDLVKRMVAVK